MHGLLKHPLGFPLLFLLVQAMITFSGLVPPATDFETVYLPNAINFSGSGNLPLNLVPDGNINRFGTMPPGYSLFLSMFLSLGAGIVLLKAIMILLGGGLLFLWRKIAAQAGVTEKYIYYFSWIFLMHPLLVVMSAGMGAELLFSILLASFIYMTQLYHQQGKPIYLYMAMFSLALAAEVRVAAWGLLAIFVLGTIILNFKRVQLWLPGLLVAITIYIQFDAPVYHYYLHRTMLDGLSRFPDNEAAQQMIKLAAPAKLHYLSAMIQAFTEAAVSQPGQMCMLVLRKLTDPFWAFDSGRIYLGLILLQVALLAVTIWFLKGRFMKTGGLLWISLVYFWLVAAGSLSICRYLMPVLPVLILFPVLYLQQRKTA